MKKFMILSLILTLALLVNTSSTWAAHSYDFPNETFVHERYNNKAGNKWGTWVDTIPAGPTSVFQTFGSDLVLSGSTYTLTIYTNLSSAGANGASFSDIFFDDGSQTGALSSWEYVFDVSVGKIYQLGTGGFSTSWDIWETKSTSAIYGGEFDPTFSKTSSPSASALVPTRYDSGGSELGTNALTIVWNTNSTKDGTYQHTFSWDKSIFDPYTQSGLWVAGTGDCSNDATGGKVPLPGAVLLLGAGLARLVAYGRRQQES